MTDKVQKIREEVKKLHGNPYYIMAVNDVLKILDMQEEPVSEDLEKAAKECMYSIEGGDTTHKLCFIEGANWQEEKDNEEKVLIYKHGFNDCKEHIKEVLLSEVLPCFMHGGEADEVAAKLDEVLNKK